MSCGCYACKDCKRGAKYKIAKNFAKGGLKRWFKENWETSDGKPCGNDTKKEEACRPTKKVNEKTPKTWNELSESEKDIVNRKKRKATKKGKQFADYGKITK